MKHQVVSVTEFKAKCLALLDGIEKNGGTITITKRGRPLAKVGPVRPTKWKSLEGTWAGKLEIDDDALMADRSDLWDAVRQSEGAKF
jgi:prevent-host-death family protein